MIIDYEFAFYSFMVASIVLVFWLEALLPLDSSGWEIQHLLQNFGLWLIAFLCADYIIGYYLIDIQSMIGQQPFGMFYWWPPPFEWTLVVIGVLLLELADYFYHRFSHHNPILWRLHAVHHTDTRLDVSTTLRTHPLELITANFCRYGVALAFGFPIWVIGFRELIIFPVLFMQHGNIKLSHRTETLLSFIIVTPRIHRLHHSTLSDEHNSNYCRGFIWWDRLFGTFQQPTKEKPKDFGILNYTAKKYQSIAGMLLTPFILKI